MQKYLTYKISKKFSISVYESKYANLDTVGKGYDLVIGDLFQGTGIRHSIFNPLEKTINMNGQYTCGISYSLNK